MTVKITNHEIRLTVRDLLLPLENNEKMHVSFTLPQRGVIGKELQKQLQQKKPDAGCLFFREYRVDFSTHLAKYKIHISGKIDGVYKKPRSWEIEEIKSVVLDSAAFRALTLSDMDTYSEQLLFYCFFLHETEGDIKLKPVLRLGNLVNHQVRSFRLKFDPLQTANLLTERLKLIIDNIEQRDQLIQKRGDILRNFEYPLTEKRDQQITMIGEVNTALLNRQHLLISAPTGAGKTAATLYPSLKYALTHGKKVFFATSKNTQQQIVLETLAPFKRKNLDLSVVFLRAARKMCLNQTFFCHDDYCHFVKDIRNRYRSSGIDRILHEEEIVDPDRIIQLAQAETLCPSEILLEHGKIADCIVGDYNYVFEPSGSMRHFFMGENAAEWILIIDEAHNLYQRGLDYLSPKLSRSGLNSTLKLIGKSKKKVVTELKRPLTMLKKIMDKMHEEGQSAYSDQSYYIIEPDIESIKDLYVHFESAYIRYLIEKVKQGFAFRDDPLQNIYYELRRFIYVLSQINHRFQIVYRADKGGILQIQCCDPSNYLSQIIDSYHSVIAMSATIEPLNFYRSVLGFQDHRTRSVSLDSPFMNTNRKIIIVPELSTRYKHRSVHYPHYAEIIKQSIKEYSGNYIAFFPSFEFLQNVNLFLGETGSDKLIQKTEMTDDERSEILERFSETDQPHLLLAVLGGVFSESIDLKGKDCIGIIIFSPAFPKISLEREIVRFYYDQKSGNGFECAYIIPGMNKVIQAAGRLIRSAQDRGVVVIVGERFSEESLNRLFPDYWFKNPGDVIFTANFQEALRTFWESAPS